MLKILIFLSAVIVLCNPQTTSIAQKYCSMTKVCPNKTSIACRYIKNPTIKCSGNLLQIPRLKITQWHNAKRNLVALGKLSPYKKASRMGSMKWSKELEQMARFNVMTCKLRHDNCRNTNNFIHSGQNLFQVTDSKKTMAEITKQAINKWFSEHKVCNMNIINSYSPTKGKCGHFTAIVKYNSNFIGCAASTFRKGRKRIVLFACNYASTNIINKAIYISGPTASKCKTGRNVNYSGLCSQNENYASTY